MVEDALANKRAQAAELANALAQLPEVDAVCLFGSVARGRITTNSDIDLLVLSVSTSLTPSGLQARLPAYLQDLEASLSSFTTSSLRSHLWRWSRFAAHLRREGQILYDPTGALHDLISEEIPVSVASELAFQRRRLSAYSHVERFGGRMLSPLGHLYSIGRTAVFAILADRGDLEFDRDQAFDLMISREPGLAPCIQLIRQLGPFYDRVRHQESNAELPFDPVGADAEEQFVVARNALEHLLASESA